MTNKSLPFYNICFELIKDVIDNKNSLSLSVKKIKNFKNIHDKANCIAVGGLFLRNYYFISVFSKNVFKTVRVEDIIAIGICYVFGSLKKYTEKEEAIDLLKNHFSKSKVELTEEQLQEFSKLLEEKKKYHIPNVKVGTFQYFSCQYNMPIWLIKMIHSQYGREYLLPFIKASSKMPNQYVLVNKFSSDEKLIDELNKNYESITSDFYRFKLNTSIKKEAFVHNFTLMPIQQAAYSILKFLPSMSEGKVTIYIGDRNFDFFLPISRYGENNDILLLERDKKENFELVSKIKKYNQLKSFSSFESSITGVNAYISEKQDMIFYYPRSSAIELYRRNAEYAVNFDVNNLDEIIFNQKEGLDSLANFVKNEGYLVYVVDTLDLKETIIMIQKFLNSYSNFKLVHEEIFFPQDQLNSIYYYAILRKTR